MNAKRLVIAGRVQGVGFRAWMVHKAAELGISGWVRNRPDGAVEALIAGDIASVEEMARLCRRGPRMAEVSSIDEDLAEPPEEPGFHLAGEVDADRSRRLLATATHDAPAFSLQCR